MGLRTITAPGVEIKEIDKSQYAPAMTGTKCFVMGHSDKGEPYQPMEFTSRNAWINYYGDPDNEAERYFFAASMEVLNQNGVLYASRIPYDNEAYNKMVGFKYNVNQGTVKDIKSSSEYISANVPLSAVRHNGVFEKESIQYAMDNFFTIKQRGGEEVVPPESEDELYAFYNKAVNLFSDAGETEKRYGLAWYHRETDKLSSYTFISKAHADEWKATEFRNIYVDTITRRYYAEDPVKEGTNDWVVRVYPETYNYVDNKGGTSLTADEYTKEEIEGLSAITGDDKNNKEITIIGKGYNWEWVVYSQISAIYEKYPSYLSAIYNELNTNYYDKDLKGVVNYINGEQIYNPDDKDAVFQKYKDNGITINKLVESYGFNAEDIKAKYFQIKDLDNTIDKYIEITHGSQAWVEDLSKIDAYATGEEKVAAGTIQIFDKTCATLNKIVEDSRKGEKREMIGIFPVITTAANALQAQSLIEVKDEFITDYESVEGAKTKVDSLGMQLELSSADIVKEFSNKFRKVEKVNPDGSRMNTVSLEANTMFSSIQMNTEGTGFDTENLKHIGVVVYKAYLDASEGNLVNFIPVESFVGSLNPDAKNPNTGVSQFIDTIVNTNSEYIYFFSNCFNTPTTKQKLDEADIFIIKPGCTGMLGFFSKETAEEISLSKLYQSIEKCFEKVSNINDRDIDIIPDAGLANIAQYLKSIYNGAGAHSYDIQAVDKDGNPLINFWKCKSNSDVSAWKTVEFKFDNFCKNVRKDCMFIADGPRPLVLQGNKKIVRPSKPENTIDANILPNVKWITGLNTNYGAGYMDWFQIADEFSGDEFWCPPSIKAMGVYINTDLNFNYWDAPAGLNRGVIAALDTAFSPTMKQAGSIYEKNWNYAINYPYDGIVLEGQKTFQVKPSSLDRVNVRRLALRLERQCYKILRYFVYEGNTAYTRQRAVDLLTPAFNQAKVGGGLYDYKIVCDDSNNTPATIDQNELHVKIGIKPVKTIEFIMVDFVFLSTGASWSEL